jgi:hypothetical protein
VDKEVEEEEEEEEEEQQEQEEQELGHIMRGTHPPSLSPLELESRDPAYCLQFLLITPTTLPLRTAVSKESSEEWGEFVWGRESGRVKEGVVEEE